MTKSNLTGLILDAPKYFRSRSTLT